MHTCILLLRQYERLHATGVQALALLEVADVKAVSNIPAGLADLEVVPLQMPFGVGINLQKQVVFCWTHLHCTVQVTCFEERVKQQVIAAIWIVADEATSGEPDLSGWAYVRIRKVIVLSVVDEVAVLVAGSQVRQTVRIVSLRFQQFLDQGIHHVVIVEGWHRIGQQNAGHPPGGDVRMQRVLFILDFRRWLHFKAHLLPSDWSRLSAGLFMHVDFFLFELFVAGKAVQQRLLLHADNYKTQGTISDCFIIGHGTRCQSRTRRRYVHRQIQHPLQTAQKSSAG